MWNLVSAGIAVLALVFSISTFWWLNARRGKLQAYEPGSFAASECIMQLPLVIFNSGAVALAVTNLRVNIRGENDPLMWRGQRDHLVFGRDDGYRLPEPFAVHPRDTVRVFADFSWPETNRSLPRGPVTVTVEAKRGDTARWHELLKFELHLELAIHRPNFIAYSNNPADKWGMPYDAPRDPMI